MVQLGLAQDDTYVKEVAEDSCPCLAKIDLDLERPARYKEVEECINSSSLMVQMKQTMTQVTEKAIDTLNQVKEISEIDSLTIPGENFLITVGKNTEDIQRYLLRHCPSMKTIMSSDEEEKEVSVSDKRKALKIYDEGQDFYRDQDYPNAIKKYKKAVKIDRTFAFAWDMLGLSYRKDDQLKKAVKAYDKSIALDPAGRVPLMNKPIAYLLLEDYDNALIGYKAFIDVFPEDAEGYYGIGRVYHVIGDYENAIETMIQALIKYNAISSPYARDAEDNLSLFYNELKDRNEIERFTKIAEKYNLKINN